MSNLKDALHIPDTQGARDGRRIAIQRVGVRDVRYPLELQTPVLVLGLPDAFVQHGDPARLLAACGLDAAGIEASIRERFGPRPALMRAAANH